MMLRTVCLGVALAVLGTATAQAEGVCRECQRRLRGGYRVGTREHVREDSHARRPAENAHHYYMEGRTLARRGHLDAAADALETATRQDPKQGAYHLLLGKVLARNSDPKGAIAHLQEAWQFGDDRIQDEAGEILTTLGATPSGPPPSNPSRLSLPRDSRHNRVMEERMSQEEWKLAELGRPPRSDDDSLYGRLGGRKAIEAVVDELLDRAGKNPKIAKFFMNMNMEMGMFRDNLVDQLGQATGGPERYKGRNMREAHEGLGIRMEHFVALVQDLILAMENLKVPKQEQDELLSILTPMKRDIVEEKGSARASR